MTDCSLVKDELKAMLDLTDEEMKKYEGAVCYAASCISALLKDESAENDLRVVHLCAVKAYYQQLLLQGDGVKRFSAGEVSYSMDASAETAAKQLLSEALTACGTLIKDSAFAFEAV